MFLSVKLFIPVRKTFQDVGEELGLAPVAGASPKWLLSLLRKFHLEAIQKQLNAIYSLPFKGRGLSAVIVSAFNPFRAFDGQPCFSISASRGEVGACVQDFDSIPIL